MILQKTRCKNLWQGGHHFIQAQVEHPLFWGGHVQTLVLGEDLAFVEYLELIDVFFSGRRNSLESLGNSS